MKKLAYLFILAALPGFKAAAQTATVYQDRVKVTNRSVTRNEANQLVISMDVVLLQDMEVKSNSAAYLTPMLQKDGHVKALPPIVVYGRRRQIMNERNNRLPTDAYTVMRRDKGEEQTVQYLTRLPFEAWMRNARLVMDADLCGCRDLVEAESLDPITTLDIEHKLQPRLAYITPKAEAVKHRAVEGRAFLDFPVNKTQIFPEYRKNTAELAKIRATIDTIRADKNISITGISMHGYASPEGGYANNARLARGRTEALLEYVKGLYSFDSRLLSMESTPEDWKGFREYVAASDMKRKEEVLQIMDLSEADMDAKEKRIARLVGTETYRMLLNDCYPALRHSDYTVDYTVRGFTVEESRDIIKTHPQQLSLQEFFNLAQGYSPGSEEFKRTFVTAVSIYPDDPIANLNAAVMEIERGGDLSVARDYLKKADRAAGETQNALGVIALIEGRFDEAEACFKRAQAAGVTVAEENLEELAKERNFPRE